jgi:hypothetical protein
MIKLAEEKKSIRGIKGNLWQDDFLRIASLRENGYKKRELENHDGEEWLSFTENWALDVLKAKEYYLSRKMDIDTKLDSFRNDILESYEGTKSDKLMGYTTFNAVSMFWNIDIHWVVLFFVREYVRNPEAVSFNTDRFGNMIYLRLEKNYL